MTSENSWRAPPFLRGQVMHREGDREPSLEEVILLTPASGGKGVGEGADDGSGVSCRVSHTETLCELGVKHSKEGPRREVSTQGWPKVPLRGWQSCGGRCIIVPSSPPLLSAGPLPRDCILGSIQLAATCASQRPGSGPGLGEAPCVSLPLFALRPLP